MLRDREGLKTLAGRIRKLLPGGVLMAELERLEKEKREHDLKILEIREIIEKKRNDFNERLIKFKCKECGKVCKSAGGLASHLSSHEEKQ
jgi:hypothetical protein